MAISEGIFISLCATALLLSPTANAYTAIAVADSSPTGEGEQWAYQFFNPETPGQHGLFLSRDLSYSGVEQRAIRSCRHKGGIYPKIVVAIAKPGFFAIAVLQVQDRRIVGWSGPESSYYHSFEKTRLRLRFGGTT
jgi:hypothetical protein